MLYRRTIQTTEVQRGEAGQFIQATVIQTCDSNCSPGQFCICLHLDISGPSAGAAYESGMYDVHIFVNIIYFLD